MNLTSQASGFSRGVLDKRFNREIIRVTSLRTALYLIFYHVTGIFVSWRSLDFLAFSGSPGVT
ncbi:hypothetical protein CCP3SC5AM1_330005 [Gammaproteobacteria bacterium]